MTNYNPYLSQPIQGATSLHGGGGFIEAPEDAFMNIAWQTRARAPTYYESALAETLAQLFASGARELGEVVAGLQQSGPAPSPGGHWSEETFLNEMARLANPEVER